MSKNHLEIERKFLIADFPIGYPLISAKTIWQGYLSVNPEIRIRKSEEDGITNYKLTIKSDGSLVRQEAESFIDNEIFSALAQFINRPLITKEYRSYMLPGGLVLECSQVDTNLSSSFMYAEIEFATEESAVSFEPLNFFTKEVTYDNAYKMKNYWTRTRG